MSMHTPAGGLTEYGHHYTGGEFLPFYVPRREMPQVDEQAYPTLIEDMMGDSIGCAFKVVSTGTLHAHQRINHAFAKAMEPQMKLKPILVSADGFILDGNHRWWSHVHSGDEWISTIRIGLNFDAAIHWLLAKSYVYRLNNDAPPKEDHHDLQLHRRPRTL